LVERIIEIAQPPRNSTPRGGKVVQLSLHVSFLIQREGFEFFGKGLYHMFSSANAGAVASIFYGL